MLTAQTKPIMIDLAFNLTASLSYQLPHCTNSNYFVHNQLLFYSIFFIPFSFAASKRKTIEGVWGKSSRACVLEQNSNIVAGSLAWRNVSWVLLGEAPVVFSLVPRSTFEILYTYQFSSKIRYCRRFLWPNVYEKFALWCTGKVCLELISFTFCCCFCFLS